MCRWLLKLIRTEVKDMSDYSTIQQYQPLRVPASFDTQGKQFIVQLNEILDDIYRRFGRLGMSDMSKKFRTTIDGKYDIVSGIDITDEGVDISGGKYIKLASGDYIKVGDWQFDENGLKGKVIVDTQYGTEGFFAISPTDTIGDNRGVRLNPGADLDIFVKYFRNGNYPEFKFTFASGGSAGYWWKSSHLSGETDKIGSLYGLGQLGKIDSPVYNILGSQIYGLNIIPWDSSKNAHKAGTNFPSTAQTACGSIGDSNHYWQKIYGSTIYYADLVGPSSRSVKHNIKAMEDEGERLDRLTPVTFAYNNDKDERKRYGLIWEDTVGIMPEICHERDGEKSINYVELVPMLLKENQTLRKRVASLEERISRLEGMLNV